MTLFQNKYRIESTRFKGWNYASEGSYFITICTRDRYNLFGRVVNAIVRSKLSYLSDLQ